MSGRAGLHECIGNIFGIMVAAMVCLMMTGRSGAEVDAITSAASIRSLSRDEAARSLPVRITGTVVLQIGRGRVFNIHDGSECVAVHYFKALDQGFWQGAALDEAATRPGSYVQIEGITDPAGYVPVIVPKTISVLGQRPLPMAKRVPFERLIAGSETSQLVELEGVVQGARKLATGFGMELMINGHLCDVKVQNKYGLDPARLVDARIRISGCASVIFNLRSEAVGIRLLVQNQDRIEILRPPPSDPFLAPRVPLRGLLPFSRDNDRFHRKMTHGVVSFVQAGEFFFMQDGGTGVRVDAPGTEVRVGDLVDVSGFVDTSLGIASLEGAVSRTLDKGFVTQAVEVAGGQLLKPPVNSPIEPVSPVDHYGALVRLTGIVRNYEWLDEESSARMRIDTAGCSFDVRFPRECLNKPEPWPIGAEVAVTGVCEPRLDSAASPLKFPITTGFTLWSRSPDDVVIFRTPSWWTPSRLAIALGGSLVVLVLSLAWTWTLRRKVSQQMGIISDKLRGQAVSEERNRMARDLHDTLEQMLAGVSLQLDDVEESIREDQKAALQSADRARRMLEFTRTEARRSVWDLRSQVLESQGLEAAIRAMVESALRSNRPVIEFTVNGRLPDLAAMESYNLLHMCQEALANAIKHAAASRICISLETSDATIVLRITDNGSGFSPGMLERSDRPHFGVLGMRERAARISANLSIEGEPGKGCEVTIQLLRGKPMNS
jgi:signal transduction histidine kinase